MKKIIRAAALLFGIILTGSIVFAAGDFGGYTENFDSLSEGVFSCANWNVVRSSTVVDLEEGNKAVKLAGKNGRIIWSPEKSINQSIRIETSFMQKSISDVYAVVNPGSAPYGADNMAFVIGTEKGSLVLRQKVSGYSDSYTTSLIENYQPDQFYKLTIICNMQDKTFRVWVDGNVLFGGISIPFAGKNVNGIDRFNIQIDKSEGDLYIDDFSVFPYVTKDDLRDLLNRAVKCRDNTPVGNHAGECTKNDKQIFEAAITEAEDEYNSLNDTIENVGAIFKIYNKLNTAYDVFQASVLTEDLDTSKLLETIDAANTALSEASVGEALGQNPPEAADELKEVINKAQQVYEDICNGGDSSLLKVTIEQVELAVQKFNDSKNRGYKKQFNDNFEAFSEGAGQADFIQNGWTTVIGNITTEKKEDTMSAVLSTDGANGNSRLVKSFEAGSLNSAVTFEFSFMLGEKTSIDQITEVMSAPWESANLLFEISSDVNNVYLKHSNGKKDILILNYEAQKWYSVKAEISIQNKSFKIYINNNVAFEGAELGFVGRAVTSFDRINFRVTSDKDYVGKKKLCIDNISVYREVTGEFEDLANTLKKGIGTDIYKDIDLIGEFNGAAIKWETSNPNVISQQGEVQRAFGKNQKCILTMNLSKDGFKYIESFAVNVIGFDDTPVFEENFNALEENSIPDLMYPQNTADAGVRTVNGEKCLYTNTALSIQTDERHLYPSAAVEFKFMASDGSNGTIFELKNKSDSLMKVSYAENKIQIGEDSVICPSNQWIDLAVVVDFKNGSYTVYVNHNAAVKEKQLSGKILENGLCLSWGSENVKMYFDDMTVGIQKLSQLNFLPGGESLLKSVAADISHSYEVEALDLKGRTMMSCPLEWKIVNKQGENPQGISLKDGVLTVSPNAESGEYELQVKSAYSDIKAIKTITISNQDLKEIEISGNARITGAGTYLYTARGISIYGTIVPIENIVWSVTGNTKNVSISKDGSLSVGTGAGGSINVSAAVGSVNASYPVTISLSVSGNGGFSGGRGSGTGTPAGNPNIVKTDPETTREAFVDLEHVAWARDAINELQKRGIINGTDEKHFEPDSYVTREQYIKMIIDVFGFTDNNKEEKFFTDVEQGRWSYRYIQDAYKNGIAEGYADGSFGAGNYIKREEAAVIIARALEKKNIKVIKAELKFSDSNIISDYAKAAAAALNAMEIINGKDGNLFDPAGNTTRAEAAVMMMRILDVIGR